MEIWVYTNQMSGKTPTDLRMRVPPPFTNFVGLNVTSAETLHKAVTQSPMQSGQDYKHLEDWLSTQPQRFSMMGINLRRLVNFLSVCRTREQLAAQLTASRMSHYMLIWRL
jgi:hypothetical protein